jgi:membrane protease YdiL (CAAX protease family)
MKSFGRAFDLIFAFVIIWVIPILSGLIANLFKPIASSIDPDGVFFWISVHHVSQLALTIFLMKLFRHTKLSIWGFNLRQSRLSLKIFASFCLIYFIPVFFFNVLPNLVSANPPSFNYPLIPRNVAGILGFQFLLSGIGEEPLFRGFVMTFLSQSWKGNVRIWNVNFPIAGLWTTLFFMVAHVNISLVPFSISASFWQQIWALGLGLYYAAVFDKTKSLLAPILSHGYSNGVIFVVLYTWTLLIR